MVTRRNISKKKNYNSHATNLESSQYLINFEDIVAVDDLKKKQKTKTRKNKERENSCKREIPIAFNEKKTREVIGQTHF